MITASPVIRAISAAVTIGEAAKPHAPFTITRTPNPKLESSATPGTASVLPVPRSGDTRRLTRWSRSRTIRISQYVALSFLASRSAFAASFSNSGLGTFESLGAPNIFSAKNALEDVAINPRRVSIR